MEISGVSGSYASQAYSQESLTEEQKITLEEILAKYDAENLTEEDRHALMDELRAASIPRTQETGQILMEAGFAPAAPQGAQGGPPPGPPPGVADDDEEDDENSELLALIAQVKSGEINQNEFMSLLEDYAKNGGSIANGSVVDKTA